jgi:hypothetical protein
MLVEAILFIAFSLLISYFVIQFIQRRPTYQGSSALYDLSKGNTPVLSYDDMPWTNEPSSLRLAIFVEAAPKTISKVDCTTADTEFKPSCENYEYKKCRCSSSDCSRCDLSETNGNYLSKLLSYGDSIQLWASGYTSQNDKPYVPAILRVKTASSSTQSYMESISLPAIPLQRWTVITIVKEGRRFDVYYGAKAVATKLLEFPPLATTYSAGWLAGNPLWKGQIGLFSGIRKVQTTSDVLSDVESLVNTRGVPFYLDELTFDFNVSMPECLFGNCNALPVVKPMNPFAVYVTNVQ